MSGRNVIKILNSNIISEVDGTWLASEIFYEKCSPSYNEHMNLIIKGKHKKTLIFPVFSGDSVFNRIYDWLSFWSYNTRSGSY